jgi:hypothetical protein
MKHIKRASFIHSPAFFCASEEWAGFHWAMVGGAENSEKCDAPRDC